MAVYRFIAKKGRVCRQFLLSIFFNKNEHSIAPKIKVPASAKYKTLYIQKSFPKIYLQYIGQGCFDDSSMHTGNRPQDQGYRAYKKAAAVFPGMSEAGFNSFPYRCYIFQLIAPDILPFLSYLSDLQSSLTAGLLRILIFLSYCL